jgi:mannose-6-phosphate isomerase
MKRFNHSIKVVKKPWGEERWFANANGYAGKLLLIHRGRRLSLQYHRKKDETIFVDKGRLRLTWKRRSGSAIPFNLPSRVFGPGAAVRIPPMTIHRFEAITHCRLIEVSVGPLSDVVRLDDDYGRT